MNRRIFVFDILGLGVFSIIKNKIKFIKNTGMVRSVSTWKTSDANLKAGQLLDKGSNSLDAAVEGVAIEESNPNRSNFLKPIVCMIPRHLMAAHVPPVIRVDPSGIPRLGITCTF